MENGRNRYFGTILRLERLRQGKEQKEVCYGICVPSYLCKIEKHRVEPDSGLLKQLLSRLDIQLQDDPEFLNEYQRLIMEYWRRMKFGFDRSDLFQRVQKEKEKLFASIFAIDCMLILEIQREEEQDTIIPSQMEKLDLFEDSFSNNQRAYYYMLKAENGNSEERLAYCQKAYDILRDSQSYSRVMQAHFLCSSYAQVQQMEKQCVSLALEEGNLVSLMNCYELLGGSYAVLNMEEMMCFYYEKCLNLIQGTIWKDKTDGLYYNMGAVSLELNKYEEALDYFSHLMVPTFSSEHKRALTYIRMGNQAEAAKVMEQVRILFIQENYKQDSAEYWMLKELEMEITPGYKYKPESLVLLKKLQASLRREKHLGFLYFYKEIIQEVYCAQRQYKKTLELEKEISKLNKKS
ncbi:MAG: hypothetical protein RRZ33_08995 [Lachnospiraceae bacterium]